MGDSEKLDGSGPGRYRFVEHREFLDAALAALGVESNVTWVVHDWGSALGFDWANRHRGATKGIAYMEAIVRPLTWEEWPDKARRVFQGFRSEAGEQMVLENNVFVERVLPGSVLRELTDREMSVYRAPYIEPGESRRPTLTWPREIPLEGTPADVTEIVRSYAEWMSENDLPKLFVNAEPGANPSRVPSASSAADGRTRTRSPSRAPTSSRRIPRTRSGGRWPNSCGVSIVRNVRGDSFLWDQVSTVALESPDLEVGSGIRKPDTGVIAGNPSRKSHYRPPDASRDTWSGAGASGRRSRRLRALRARGAIARLRPSIRSRPRGNEPDPPLRRRCAVRARASPVSISSTLYPSGSSTNAMTVFPPLTGPGSRVMLPPAARIRPQVSGDIVHPPSAMCPYAVPRSYSDSP